MKIASWEQAGRFLPLIKHTCADAEGATPIPHSEQRSVSRLVEVPGRICAIFNPQAGYGIHSLEARSRQRPAEAIAQWLNPERPQAVRVHEVTVPGDGARRAAEAITEGFDTIVAIGGDGTINDVVQSVSGQSGVKLGIVPMGTANVLAGVLGIPVGNPADAIKVIRAGHVRHIDLARANGRFFSLVAGIGFDGAVTRSVDTRLKRHVGELAYLLAVCQETTRFPRHRITLCLDDSAPQTFDAYLVLVANGNRYAGRYSLSDSIQLDDGHLDVFVCLRREPLAGAVMEHSFALAMDLFSRVRGVHRFRAKRIRIEAAERLPIQLDGDGIGESPVNIEVVPHALSVFIP